MTNTRAELIYFEGCPHVTEARRRLTRALSECGLPQVWQEWNVTDEVPPYARTYGSPTVLVDGRDVRGGAGNAIGPGCAVGGAPPLNDIVVALMRGNTG
jgi:hypothetical protein